MSEDVKLTKEHKLLLKEAQSIMKAGRASAVHIDARGTSQEQGYRVLAALVSYMNDKPGVDSTLRELKKRPIDPVWTEIGAALSSALGIAIKSLREEALKEAVDQFLQPDQSRLARELAVAGQRLIKIARSNASLQGQEKKR